MHGASSALNGGAEASIVALRFGPFELDARSGELRRNGTTLRLQPQPVKVLLLLAARPGEVVAREEIQAEVWPAGTFVDFEQSLNFCIRQIRGALGDNAAAPRYVETLPRRGYRWVGGPVERVTGSATVHGWPRAVDHPPADTQEAVPAAHQTGVGSIRPRWSLVGVVAVFAVGALAAGWLLARARPLPAEHPVFQRVTFRRGALGSARFGPDGQIVYSAAWDGGARLLYVARSDPRDVQALEIGDAMVVGVSSSGEVAFLREGVLARAPLAGGPPKEVLKHVVAADWTAGATDFAVARWADGRYRIEFPVGHVLEQTRALPRTLRLSRDGQHLAVVLYPTLADDRGLVEILDRNGRRAAATPEWASLDGLAWRPDGSEVWFTAAQVGSDNSLRALGLDGRVRQVLSGTGRLVLHDIAPDGRVLLERATLRSEMLFRRTGEPVPRDLSWLDYSAAAGISPDAGTLLFYESGEGGGADYTTFLRRTDGSPPVRVGSGRALDLSPDGRYVLSVDLGQADHLDLTPTGPGETRRLRVPGMVAHEEAGFVGDGGRVFVTGRDAEGVRSSWIVDLSGSAPRRLPLPPGRFLVRGTFSPDGGRFVAPCPEEKTACFYDTASGKPSPVRAAKEGWMAVGFDARGELYFRTRDKRPPETLVRLDPATGRTAVVAELSPLDPDGASWVQRVFVARDGGAWAYNVLGRLSDLHVVTGLR